MKKTKRMLSSLIVLSLVLSLMSVSVFGAPKFKDVSSNQWYYKYVTGIVDKGVMTGTSSNTFSPNATVTRAQIVQTLYAMAGKPKVTKNSGFKDVASGKWYTDAISWASSVGVVAGYYDGTYRPNEAVTRQQFATVLHSYARNVETADKRPDSRININRYSDFDMVAMFALESVSWAVSVGVISSTSTIEKKLDPRGKMTRAQLATMLLSYLNYDPAQADTIPTSTISTQYYEITIPTDLRNTFYCEELDSEFPMLNFYEINQHNRDGRGFAFTIALYPEGDDFTYLPAYDVVGSLSKDSANYTVVAFFATDVQFDADLQAQWQDLYDASDAITSGIRGINGFTFSSSYVRPKQ